MGGGGVVLALARSVKIAAIASYHWLRGGGMAAKRRHENIGGGRHGEGAKRVRESISSRRVCFARGTPRRFGAARVSGV